MDELKIGIIGIDTSHAVAFTDILNTPTNEFHVPGGKVQIAFPGGSSQFPLSLSRVEEFTEKLKNDYHVTIVDSIKRVAEESDAILLESVDGGQHLEQFEDIASFKKPVFIDKPFALSTKDTNEMIRLAEKHKTPIMSTSALRFAQSLQSTINITSKGKIIGADCFGPMEILPGQPGFFWYGIHTIEMLFTILGDGPEKVTTITHDDYDLITATWKDGRMGTVRGNRKGNQQFGALIHFEKDTKYVDVSADTKPYYASLLEQIMSFFHDRATRVPLNETKHIIRFIEVANESRETGKTVYL